MIFISLYKDDFVRILLVLVGLVFSLNQKSYAATELPGLDVGSAELRPVKFSYHFLKSYLQAATALSDQIYKVQPLISMGKQRLSPKDLDVIIQSQEGLINVPIERDGGVQSLTVSNRLEKEDPIVTFNQPKGYPFHLTIQVVLPVPRANVFSYSILVEDLKWSNHLFKKGAGFLFFLAPHSKEIRFMFSEDHDLHKMPVITVNWKNKIPESIQADSQGFATLTIDRNTKENPQVNVSELPEKMTVVGY